MSVDMQKTQTFPATGPLAGYPVARVNLLPTEILAERRLRRTQLGLGAVVLGVVGAVAAGFVLAASSAATAEDELAAEQARTKVLTDEQAEYAEVPLVLGQVEAAQAARATAMATDVLWYEYLSHLSASYPQDVWMRDLTATVATAGRQRRRGGRRDARLRNPGGQRHQQGAHRGGRLDGRRRGHSRSRQPHVHRGHPHRPRRHGRRRLDVARRT